MNIVFLDIDGVLASWLKMGKMDKEGNQFFEPAAVDALNEITNHINAKIVVSSDWRRSRTLEELKELLKNRGVKGEVIGKTGILESGRGYEIQEWIDDNELDYFIIIDDKTREIEKCFPEDRNVLRTNLYRCLDHYDFLYVKRGFKLHEKNKIKES